MRLRYAFGLWMTLPVLLVVLVLSAVLLNYGQTAVEQLTFDSLGQVNRRIIAHLEELVSEAEDLNRLHEAFLLEGQLDINHLPQWRVILYNQVKVHSRISSVGFGGADGRSVWVSRYPENRGHRIAFKEDPKRSYVTNYALTDKGEIIKDDVMQYDYDVLVRPWFTQAVAAGKPVWTDPYVWTIQFGSQPAMSIGHVWPVKDKGGELIGVLDAELTFFHLSSFLETLKIGKNGFAMVLDRKGHMLANSSSTPIVDEDDNWALAVDSTNPRLAAAARALEKIDGQGVTELTFRGERYFLMSEPFELQPGDDWIVVTVVPETDFTSNLAQLRQRTWSLGLGSVVLAVLFGLLLGWNVATPVTRLAARVREGDMEAIEVMAERNDELGQLAEAFWERQQRLLAMRKDLMESEAHFRSLIENASDITLEVEEAGQLVYASPSLENLGYEPRRVLGKPLANLIDPEDRDWVRHFRKLDRAVEVHLLDADGQHHQMEAVVSLPARGNGLVWTLRDVTARRRIEELETEKRVAEETSRAKSAFLANMSHELRTPMNSIIGFSEMLLRRLGPEMKERDLDSLQTIERNAKHLLELINELLDLSKVEAGKMTVHTETFELDSMVYDVVLALKPMAESNANVLEVEGKLEAELDSDRTKVRQILYNLVSNACKFTRDGKVTVRVAGDENGVKVEVVDTGIGMTQDQLNRLFTPFTQADDSISRRFGGTGLGLAISRQYAQMLGGDIEVSSVPDQGSTFSLRLPWRLSEPS